MTHNAILTLTQWLSPGFPVSAYAYSHGFEQAIDSGAITSSSALEAWLEDLLLHGSGRADAILLSCAYRAEPKALPEIDAVARAFAASSERLTETVDQGHAFVRTVNEVWSLAMPPLSYPVAVGHAARLKGLPLDLTLEIYVHAFAATLVSAAVRLVPLGQTEGQAVLARMASSIERIAEEAQDADLDALHSNCFALDIAAMNHETQYAKVFRT